MLYDLEPAEEITGGPWYTDTNDFDEVFVVDLLKIIHKLVDEKTYPSSSSTIQDRFYNPTYREYPTAEEIYEYIVKSKVLTDIIDKETFGVSQVHQLLEVACLNKTIAKRTDGVTYRSIYPDEDFVLGNKYYNSSEISEDQNDILGHSGFT